MVLLSVPAIILIGSLEKPRFQRLIPRVILSKASSFGYQRQPSVVSSVRLGFSFPTHHPFFLSSDPVSAIRLGA